jgi:Uma2 family endonuclease
MPPPTLTSGDPSQLPHSSLRRFSVAEYRRMGEAGVLSQDDRVELLEGWIVRKMVHNPPHDATVDLVAEVLRNVLPPGWRIRIQSAITTQDSEPEPDLAVVRGQASTYVSRHPGADDIGLLIEVADASLGQDRGLKLRLYARASIGCYWIVNLADRLIEVHEGPSGAVSEPSYRHRRAYAASEEVPFSIEGREIARVPVASLIP